MEAGKLRVLVADDTDEGRYLLERLLRGLGHEVVSTGNGAEALQELRTQDFDLIITDILMPVMDGFLLCMHVKQDEQLRKIPLVFYSATYVDEHDENLAMIMGAHRFIRKPMEPEKFVEILNAVAAEVCEGKIQPGEPSMEEREILFQRYNERVVNKLEQKMRELEQEIAERRKAESARRETATLLDSLIEALPDSVYFKDLDRRHVLVSKAYADFFGVNRKEVIGKTIDEFVPSDEAGQSRETDEAVIRTRQPLIAEHSWSDGRGGKCIFETRKFPILDDQGHVIAVGGISRDITDRKQAENVMLARLRLTDYSVSHTLEELLQATLDEVEGLTDSAIGFYHFVEADQRTLWLQAWSTRTLREMCTAEGKGLHYNIDDAGVWVDCVHERRPVIHNDYSALPHRRGTPVGHADVIRELVVPVIRGDRIVAVLGVGNKPVNYEASDIQTVSLLADLAWDIAERKRAEQVLRQSEELHRLTISNISDTVLITDDNGAFTYICPNTSLIFGHSQEEVEALGNVTQLMGRILFDPLQLESRKQIDNIEWTIIDKGGREHVLLVNVKRVSIKGGTVLYTCRDITDRKRADESLRESHAFLDTLLNAIPAPVFYKDTDGCYIGFNKSFEEVYGKTRQDLVGKSVFDIAPRELAEVSHAKDLELFRNPGVQVYDSQVQDARGAVHDAVFHKATFSNPQGHVLGLIGVILDITERKRAEEAVDRANQEWELTFDAISDPVMVLDDQHRILRANKAMADALGMMEQELMGKHCFELVHGEKEPPAFCPHSQLLTDGVRHSAEVVEPRLGGIQDVRVSPIIDQNGRVIGSVHVTRDITERISAERELQKSNELLRAVIEAAPTAIVGLDLDGNVQMIWNPAAEKMLGWSAQEVMGRLLPSVPAESQEEFRGFRDRIRSGKTLNGVEVRRQRRDGTPIDYSIYASPLHDAEGRITGNVCVLVDITDRKRSQEALRASEEKYRTLFEESIDGVYSVLRYGEITDANASFCKLFDYTREEMIGKDIGELYVDPADRPKFQKEIQKKGFVKDYEVKLRKRDGTVVDCLITSSVHFGEDGSITGYRGILRDLTLRKALQRQLLQAQKMESIGTLAGGIAHDFNNLLQVVLGYSDMLLFNRKPTDPDYEGLHAIRQAGRDGSELANRILAFSRRLEPNARPVSLNNEIQRVEKMLKRTLPKMIETELYLADDLITVNADPGQMEQILLNLAVNAQHAMPDGGRLTIETENIALDEEYCRIHVDVEPGQYVLLSVSDTGHGMDKEVVEHIFEPFFTTKGPSEGTGLGLAMVYGIVRSHKGHIICYSEPGMGTTFKIYLPAIVQVIEQDVAATQLIPAFGTETILLVDDEKSIRKLGEEMLRMVGYSVLTAANGRAAIDVYRSNQDRIALVVLDLMMPKMGGKRCLEELLKINPGVKVVIASGYSVNGPTKDAIEAGAKGFISKPYDAKEFLRTVRKFLDESP